MVTTKFIGDQVVFENLTEEEINIGFHDRKFGFRDLIDAELATREVRKCFFGKNLVVRNCPNLKILDLHGLKLRGLKIENCPNLETLNISYNNILNIDLSDCKKLVNLFCSNNILNKLDVTANTSLINLSCDNNFIKELNVTHLKELEVLYCFKCRFYSSELDVSNLKNLVELNCANSFLTKLNVSGCDSLEILDCAENKLQSLVIVGLPKIKTVSCKLNPEMKILDAGKAPNLEFIDYTRNLFIKNKKLRSRFFGSNNIREIYCSRDCVPAY